MAIEGDPMIANVPGDLVDEPAFEEVFVPDATPDEKLALYVTSRALGTSPLEDMEQLLRERQAQRADAA